MPCKSLLPFGSNSLLLHGLRVSWPTISPWQLCDSFPPNEQGEWFINDWLKIKQLSIIALFNYVSLFLSKTKMTRETVSFTELWEQQKYLCSQGCDNKGRVWNVGEEGKMWFACFLFEIQVTFLLERFRSRFYRCFKQMKIAYFNLKPFFSKCDAVNDTINAWILHTMQKQISFKWRILPVNESKKLSGLYKGWVHRQEFVSIEATCE